MIDRRGGATTQAVPSVVERVPPHSLEAEMAVLGSVLLESDVLGDLVPLLEPGDFYRRAHRRIFEVMLELYDRGRGIDPILVFRECEQRGILEDVGGAEYVAKLPSAAIAPGNAEHYARIIREKALARALIAATTEIQQAAFAEQPGDELLEIAERRVFELGSRRAGGEAHGVKDLLNDAFEEIARGEGPVQGVQTGFVHFDDLTTGLRPGELIIVAGRPSMGKSSFALNVAMNAAIRDGRKVAIFTLEMTAQNVVRNMLCALAKFPGQKLRKGGRFISNADRTTLSEAAGPLFEADIFIDDTPALSPMLLRSKARRLKAQHGLDLIVVDYLQLMEAGVSSRGIDNRQQEISYISRSMKGLARELQVPVIALSQLNRDAEKREGNRPKLSDLRESGAIEQDADVICLLYRKFYYSRQDADRNLAQVIIAKQRNGPTDTVNLVFLDECMRFDNPDRRELGSM